MPSHLSRVPGNIGITEPDLQRDPPPLRFFSQQDTLRPDTDTHLMRIETKVMEQTVGTQRIRTKNRQVNNGRGFIGL